LLQVVKVLMRDENRLVLRLEPIGSWLAVIACGSSGLGLIWVARSDQVPLWIAAITFLGFAVLVLRLMRFIELHLERKPGRVEVRRWGLFSPSETFSWSLEQFGCLRLEEKRDRFRGEPDAVSYRLEVVLVSGQRLPLTPYYDFDQRGKRHAVDLVNRFLNLE
jgi:hypothetical protein